MRAHRCCLVDPQDQGCDLSRLTVSRVDVERIGVLVPPSAGEPLQTVSVPLADYLRAAPDLWELHGADVVAHLEEHHQVELRNLAAVDVGWRPGAVHVTSLRADGMVLTCLGHDGVTDVVIPFDPPLPDPAALGRWFTDRNG